MIIDEIKNLSKPEFLNMLKDINEMHDIEITTVDTNPNPESKELIVITENIYEECHNRYRGSMDQVFSIRLKYKGVDIDVSGEYGGYGDDGSDMVDIKVHINSTDNILIKEANEMVLKYDIGRDTVGCIFELASQESNSRWSSHDVGSSFDINKSLNSATYYNY